MRHPARSSRLLAFIAIVVLGVPTVAAAHHVFDDVADDRFYAEPVEWAANLGITTGTSATTFSPDDPVTRGESVTFLKRYHDTFVVPETQAIRGANGATTNALVEAEELLDETVETVDRLDAEQTGAAFARVEDNVNNWDGSELVLSELISAPTDGFVLIRYTVTLTKDSAASSSSVVDLIANVTMGGSQIAETTSGIDLALNRRANFRTVTIETMQPVTTDPVIISGTIEKVGNGADEEMNVRDQTLSILFVPNDLSSALAP